MLTGVKTLTVEGVEKELKDLHERYLKRRRYLRSVLGALKEEREEIESHLRKEASDGSEQRTDDGE